MQVTQEQVDPCKIALTITVEPDQVKVAREKAFNQFARGLNLPGFRKGKVPAQIARSYVDEGRVKQRAAELLVEPAYQEAIEETQIEPFAGPDVEMVEMNDDGPFVFKAMVPLRPVVTLGPYKGLAVERRLLQVTDEDVDRQIEELRTRQAEFQEVTDRSEAQMGDIAEADLTANIEGQDAPELATPRATYIEIGKNIPDFDNGLVGLAIGETKTIEALYPEEFADENLRGKRATFTVTLKGLRTRLLPELNDAFAKEQKAYPDVNTVEELRAAVRAGLDKAATDMAQQDLDNRLVNQIVTTSQINYPDVLLREQMQADANELTERLKRENATLEQYLEATGKTREAVEAEIAGVADRRIRTGLVLAEVAQAEALTVEDADIEAEIAERAERARVSPAAVRAFVEKQNQMEALQNRVLTQKVFSVLRDSAQITDRSVTAEELDAEMQAEAGTQETAEAVAPADTTPAEPLGIEGASVARRRGAGRVEEGEDGATVSAGPDAEPAGIETDDTANAQPQQP